MPAANPAAAHSLHCRPPGPEVPLINYLSLHTINHEEFERETFPCQAIKVTFPLPGLSSHVPGFNAEIPAQREKML